MIGWAVVRIARGVTRPSGARHHRGHLGVAENAAHEGHQTPGYA
jgi:hypothetical protein